MLVSHLMNLSKDIVRRENGREREEREREREGERERETVIDYYKVTAMIPSPVPDQPIVTEADILMMLMMNSQESHIEIMVIA